MTFASAAHNTGTDCYLKASFLFSGAWFEILNEPACGGDVDCPLQVDKSYILRKSLAVTDKLPKGVQSTRWKLVCNAAADEIFCGDISVNVA